MDSVKDYVELIDAPWGRMFYDLLFIQLAIPNTLKQNILDFGSGLGVTSNYYAAWHSVTAVEPDSEMIDNSRRENEYRQINGGIKELAALKSESYDYLFCHNVLEYVEDKESIIASLMRLLKPSGILSIVKHNRFGRVFQSAVFGNNPQKALSLLNPDTNDKSNYLGTQYLYTNADAAAWAEKYGGRVNRIYGMRTFWALGQDNSIKHTDDWYQNMLLLERKAALMPEYQQVAFFNHLMIVKKDGR